MALHAKRHDVGHRKLSYLWIRICQEQQNLMRRWKRHVKKRCTKWRERWGGGSYDPRGTHYEAAVYLVRNRRLALGATSNEDLFACAGPQASQEAVLALAFAL